MLGTAGLLIILLDLIISHGAMTTSEGKFLYGFCVAIRTLKFTYSGRGQVQAIDGQVLACRELGA